MDAFDRKIVRIARRQKAEEEGRVADSFDVRKSLLDRVKRGEMTLEEAQKELRRIKRNAKAQGKVTRSQAANGL